MDTSKPLRVLIADDHPISRSGLEFLLAEEAGVEVVGSARDGAEALSQIEALEPDVVILDLMLPIVSGLLVLETLQRIDRRPSVIAISGQASGLIFQQAKDLGANALVSKEDSSDVLLEALQAMQTNQRFFSPTVTKLLGPLAEDHSEAALTPREREILALVAGGLSNSDIGEKLHISPKTAKKHRENIRLELGISSAVEATQVAARLGLTKIN